MQIDTHFLTFFALIMSLLSLWIHRSAWLWASFLVLSCFLAEQAGIISFFTIIPLGALFLIHLMLRQPLAGKERLGLFCAAALISAGLLLHKIPGITNWHVDGTVWFYFDEPFVGLFVLALQLPLVRSKQEWSKALLKAVPLTVLAIAILICAANFSGTVMWGLKWPSHLFLRMLAGFFLMMIPQEAFFRGFVQGELFRAFGEGIKGGVGSIVITSAAFTLYHLSWTSSLALLGFIFFSSILYGAIYQYTRQIESAIICRFTVNLLLLLFGSFT